MVGSKTNTTTLGAPTNTSGSASAYPPGIGIPTEAGGLSFDRSEFQSAPGCTFCSPP